MTRAWSLDVDRRLTLLRHARARLGPGQSEDALFSTEESPLSERGRAEAAGARDFLRDAKFDAAYASDAARAIETAEIVAAPHGLAVEVVPDLREFAFGRPGDTYEDVLAQIVGLAFDLAEDPDPLLSGGVRYAAEKARFAAALDRILARHERPLVVAHGVTNRVWLADVLGMPAWNLFALAQDHAAINVVDYADGRATLRLLNGRPAQLSG